MARDFGLSDQLRRSSRSTMANIAEGFGRAGAREFHRFLSNAAGSNAETQSHLYVAFDCRYNTETELNELLADTEEVARLIRALQQSLKRFINSEP